MAKTNKLELVKAKMLENIGKMEPPNMRLPDDFEFLKHDLWLNYSQKRYVPPEDIRYRLEKLKIPPSLWPALRQKTEKFRQMSAIYFVFKSLGKNFWFFPSDSLYKKIRDIDRLGFHLNEKILNQETYTAEFIKNAETEEAISSAIYEGANSTRREAKEFLSSGKKPQTKDQFMLRNKHAAMLWVKKAAQDDISINSILKAHEIITKNTLKGDDAAFCGKFRNNKVFVGKHEGPPFEKIPQALDEMISLINTHPRFLHGLIKGILYHYFIAWIHPFFDGNGRTARCFFYYEAIRNKMRFIDLLSISAFLKDRGDRYTKSFHLVEKYKGDMTYFIDFCLDSLLFALKAVENKVHFLVKINSLGDTLKINTDQISLLQQATLNRHKGILTESYAKSIGKSREHARQQLEDLLQKKLLLKRKQGKMSLYFIHKKLLLERVESLSQQNLPKKI